MLCHYGFLAGASRHPSSPDRKEESSVSFLDYLKDNRGAFIDHRETPPVTLAAISWDAAEHPDPDHDAAAAPTRGLRARRRRSPANSSQHAASSRFRQLRPAFAPSPYSDPLPYEEPWERAFR
ncbi:MAG: hypothetical protein JWN41_224 [Thermoleophilia bacterium]|nr:hypothetical protein [Thermoleophilia bacterium]